jgi:hypothetical protein
VAVATNCFPSHLCNSLFFNLQISLNKRLIVLNDLLCRLWCHRMPPRSGPARSPSASKVIDGVTHITPSTVAGSSVHACISSTISSLRRTHPCSTRVAMRDRECAAGPLLETIAPAYSSQWWIWHQQGGGGHWDSGQPASSMAMPKGGRPASRMLSPSSSSTLELVCANSLTWLLVGV